MTKLFLYIHEWSIKRLGSLFKYSTPPNFRGYPPSLQLRSTFNRNFSIHIVWLFFLLQELDGPNVSRAGKKLTLDPVEWKRLNQLYSIFFFDVDTTGTAVDCWKAIDSYLCNRKMAEQACTNWYIIKLLFVLFRNFYRWLSIDFDFLLSNRQGYNVNKIFGLLPDLKFVSVFWKTFKLLTDASITW